MKILVSWLRDLVQVPVGVDTLAEALTMRGFEVAAIDPAPAATASDQPDAILDLEVTTNRPDCLSVAGIAREVSTIYGHPVTWPELADVAAGAPRIPVTIADDARELCPRYAASVADVTVGPSPDWLATRLEAADVRPVNNIVDITNYVLLELGHPMHAFDLDRLEGGEIQVRRARPGEPVRTLDGVSRTLRDDMLVIADAGRAQAVAGVMGGADSEVTAATRRVAFEAAYFQPVSVRRTSKRLALSTEASYRFERGADVEAPVRAMRRAQALLVAVGAGTPHPGLVDCYPTVAARVEVTLRHARIRRVLGLTVDPTFVARTLDRLGFDVEPVSTDPAGLTWRVTVPTHRVDVHREIDLIEEVARHHGYDRLPSTFPAMATPPARPPAALDRRRTVRRVLTASGCSEAITYGFIEDAAARPFEPAGEAPVRLANPLSEKFAVLRPSLVPGVVDALIYNRRREHPDVRLFEIGHRFTVGSGEGAAVAIAMTGAAATPHWSDRERQTDLFDLTGIITRVCDALGVAPTFTATTWPSLVPGRAAQVQATAEAGGALVRLGQAGELQPAIAKARGLPAAAGAVYVAELDLEALATVATDRRRMVAAPLPRHPSVVRDLAVVVDAALPAATVRGTIQKAVPDTLLHVHEFDRYRGRGVPDGAVSLAFRLTFRAPDRTLTDTEVQRSIDAVVAALTSTHNATLR